MSKNDNVKKIKAYIDDILGTKSNLRDKLPSKKSKEKELFCEILILTDKETNDVIPSDTPEDIWDLIQEQKNAKKGNK